MMMQELKNQENYESFLSSVCARQWKRLGTRRRAGINTSLFSLYSKESTGIGEIPDFKLLIDWCVKTGHTIIQLLPMNDVGFDFRPYDAQSTFALDPMFARLENFEGVKAESFKKDFSDLRNQFPAGKARVDYGIKGAKLRVMEKMFLSCEGKYPEAFLEFQKKQDFWLTPYCFFKVLKEKFPQSGWEGWPEEFREHREEALELLKKESGERFLFHAWLQWQLDTQFRQIKTYAGQKGVLLMGDLPFLVSRDSADVWWLQSYFKLDRVSGAPPDAYIAEGQRWGMPPYQWETIAAHNYDYIREKVRYAARFYDMFRIDHVVGLFRLWTIAADEPLKNAGRVGSFDPQDESLWEEHGKKILFQMMEPTDMLPCAEDLGVVPECSTKVLGEFSIPGMDVQRWARHWEQGSFKEPEQYRPCSCSVISTHDMPILLGWWRHEMGTVDEWIFRRVCTHSGFDYEAIRERLFEEPVFGRLRWNSYIQNTEDLIRALGREPHQIQEILALCKDSFIEKQRFLEYLGLADESKDFSDYEFVFRALEKASESRSVFSVQLIQDVLSLAGYFSEDPWNARINFPGTIGDHNWSVVLPLSLEQMNALDMNKEVLNIHKRTFRI